MSTFYKILSICLFGGSIILSTQDNTPKERTSVIKKSEDQWIAIDKVQHFSYSCLVSLGVQYILVNKIQFDEKSALPYSSLMSLSAGILKELNDKKGKNGYFSFKDMVANGFGILFAGIIISFQTG